MSSIRKRRCGRHDGWRRSFGAIRGNMNLFYTWGAILGPSVAGAVYDPPPESYALVFAGITISLVVSAAMTTLLIKPWNEPRQL